jgi:hypothetical protein
VRGCGIRLRSGVVFGWAWWCLDVHETPSGQSPALPRFACHAVADHPCAALGVYAAQANVFLSGDNKVH